MNPTTLMQKAILDAATAGPEFAPSALIDKVRRLANPLEALAQNDVVTDLYSVLQEQCAFVYAPFTSNTQATQNQSQHAEFMRWLIRELREWRSEADPQSHKLFVIFLATQLCYSVESELWGMMPAGLEANQELMVALARFVAGFDGHFVTPPEAPVWEREQAERYIEANRTCDWVQLCRSWRTFRGAVRGGFFQHQIVQCLGRYDIPLLLRAVANVQKTVVAMQIMSSLGVLLRLQLAVAADNKYIQFAAIVGTFDSGSPMAPITAAEKNALTQLLLKIASDDAEWRNWMLLFNENLFVELQPSLGVALATCSDAAIHAYVESIDLHADDANRRALATECLRAFAASAPPPRRKQLWTISHQRWATWGFGVGDPGKHLQSIGKSELDYAVVGYSLECQNDADRKNALADISAKLGLIDDQWHASLLDCVTAWNRLLSLFQPYAHADQVITKPQDWIASAIYRPFDPKASQYAMMMFRSQ